MSAVGGGLDTAVVPYGYHGVASRCVTCTMGDATAGTASVALGHGARALSGDSIAIGTGAYTKTSYYSAAVGCKARAIPAATSAFGVAAYTNDKGTLVLRATEGAVDGTQLYLIHSGCDLSTRYLDGESGLAFITTDKNKQIVKCGTIKLSSLCSENNETSETPFSPDMTQQADEDGDDYVLWELHPTEDTH